MDKEWIVGGYSPSLDGQVKWIYTDAEWPTGRTTVVKEQAEQWANDFVAIANADPKSGATDWEPRVWQEE